MPYAFGPGFENRKRRFTFFLLVPFFDFFPLFPTEGRFARDSRGFTRHVFQAIVIILKAQEIIRIWTKRAWNYSLVSLVTILPFQLNCISTLITCYHLFFSILKNNSWEFSWQNLYQRHFPLLLLLFVDVSGGESSSMLVAMRDCIKASNVLSLNKSHGYTPLSFKEAFYLATLGGCQGKLSPRVPGIPAACLGIAYTPLNV